MNFVELILSNGFVRRVTDIEKKKGRYDSKFNTTNGWMGLVVYHPYEIFEKDNKSVELSLERFGAVDIIFDEDGCREVRVNEKHITCKVDGVVIYKNNFGVIPPIEIINILL